MMLIASVKCGTGMTRAALHSAQLFASRIEKGVATLRRVAVLTRHCVEEKSCVGIGAKS
jgi:hypothetical protein